MFLNWYGEGCFKLTTGGVTILIDPFEATTGLTPPRFTHEILIRTLSGMPFPEMKEMEPTVVAGPGEYEIQGVEIASLQLTAESTDKYIKSIVRLKAEDLRIVFLGHLSQVPDADVLEKLGEVDVLVVPVPGGHFIPWDKAIPLIRQLNPKVVIPSFFKVPGLKRQTEAVTDLVKEFEASAEPQEKITLKKKDLPATLHVYVPKL